MPIDLRLRKGENDTMEMFYPIVVVTIAPEDGGGYMGFAPDLGGCMSHGETPEEAFASAREAVLEWLDEAKACKRDIPAPGSASVRAKKERAELIEIIKDQNQAIEGLSKDLEAATHAIDSLKSQVHDVMARTDALSTWSGYSIAAQINQQHEDSVH